jgi:hypothetical protein
MDADVKHTPGPWMAAARPSSVVGLPVVATANGRSIASVTFFSLGPDFANHDRESAANARLIAAAPALLEALKAVLTYGRDVFFWDLEAEADEMLADADAAIALATGSPDAQ